MKWDDKSVSCEAPGLSALSPASGRSTPGQRPALRDPPGGGEPETIKKTPSLVGHREFVHGPSLPGVLVLLFFPVLDVSSLAARFFRGPEDPRNWTRPGDAGRSGLAGPRLDR